MRLIEGIEEYIQRKRSTGLAYDKMESQFMGFSRQIGDVQLRQITTGKVLDYLNRTPPSAMAWRQKYQLLLHFFEFWTFRGQMPELLMPPSRPRLRQTYVPHIFTRGEIRLLLRATRKSQANGNCQIAPQTLRALILVLYGTGAYLGELLNIRVTDVNLKSSTLTIYRKGFKRRRTIPIGKDLQAVIKRYLCWRQRMSGGGERLFTRTDGQAIVQDMVSHSFKRLRRLAGIKRHDQAHYLPRLHDMRSTFAVHRITSWIRNGSDLNRMLPALAAYMGQSGLECTERYLAMTPERFRKELNKLSPERPHKHWRDDKQLMCFLEKLASN